MKWCQNEKASAANIENDNIPEMGWADMRFCRFLAPRADTPTYGLVESNSLLEIVGTPWGKWRKAARSYKTDGCQLLAPVEPSKIVCVGRNYAAHAAELGNEMPKEPLIFLKPPSSLIGPAKPIEIPIYSKRVEHEGELGVVIGKTCGHLQDGDDPLLTATAIARHLQLDLTDAAIAEMVRGTSAVEAIRADEDPAAWWDRRWP